MQISLSLEESTVFLLKELDHEVVIFCISLGVYEDYKLQPAVEKIDRNET